MCHMISEKRQRKETDRLNNRFRRVKSFAKNFWPILLPYTMLRSCWSIVFFLSAFFPLHKSQRFLGAHNFDEKTCSGDETSENISPITTMALEKLFVAFAVCFSGLHSREKYIYFARSPFSDGANRTKKKSKLKLTKSHYEITFLFVFLSEFFSFTGVCRSSVGDFCES